MKLKEYEAKRLFNEMEIPTSKGFLISNLREIPFFEEERILKVQSLTGGRGKAGGILTVKDNKEAKVDCERFLKKKFLNEEITEVLLDEKIEIKQELYLGIMFDTSKNSPRFIFSESGGIDIEENKKTSVEINYLEGLTTEKIKEILVNSKISKVVKIKLQEIMIKLYNCFVKYDCKMLEINPLVVTPKDNLVAVDAVIVLDDDANYRREIKFPQRTNIRKATNREIAANEIDKEDHRGVAGKTFIDLDGDIAILTSGGGASMTLMDTLIELGGKPANFTEYSGNPPMEKVEKLTKIVLDKEGLNGLLIAGVIANFTDIKETLQGVVNILQEVKPKYPIVIRRAGPNDEEAKKMLKEAKEQYGLDIHYFDEKTPMTKAAEIIIDLSNKFKQSKIMKIKK